MRVRALWATCVVVAMGCGGDAEELPGTTSTLDCESDYDIYEDGLSAAGELYEVTFRSADPAPPDRGDNVWVLGVNALGGGATPELDLRVEPFMPEHGHGTSPDSFTADVVDDTYTIGPVDLFMPGLWVLTFYVEDGEASDAVEFRFCLEG